MGKERKQEQINNLIVSILDIYCTPSRRKSSDQHDLTSALTVLLKDEKAKKQLQKLSKPLILSEIEARRFEFSIIPENQKELLY